MSIITDDKGYIDPTEHSMFAIADFAGSYYSGMGDPLYRIKDGYIRVDDLDYVERMIDEAARTLADRPENGLAWQETIIRAGWEVEDLINQR